MFNITLLPYGYRSDEMTTKMGFLNTWSKFLVGAKTVMAILLCCLWVFVPFWLQLFFDFGLTQTLKFSACILLFAYVILSIIKKIIELLITKEKIGLEYRLSNKILKNILNASNQVKVQKKLSEVIELFSDDVDDVKDYYFTSLTALVPTVFQMFLGIILLSSFEPTGAVIILFALVLIIMISIPLCYFMYSCHRKEKKSNTEVTKFVNRVVEHILLVKTSAEEEREAEMAQKLFWDKRKVKFKSTLLQSIVLPVYILAVGAIILGAIVLISQKISLGFFSTGSLVAYLYIGFKVVMCLVKLIVYVKGIIKGRISVERIRKIWELKTEEGTQGEHCDSISNVEFSGVDFSYGSHKVINNISLNACKGQVIAFVGASGAGKTTLFRLLEGFIQPNQGEIFFNHNSMKNYDIKSLRKRISYVTQEVEVFEDTLRENLTYGVRQELSDEDIIMKLRDVPCFAFLFEEYTLDDIIHKGELSGGQKQRLAIARAYLQNSDMWLLDEVTANLDAEAENNIQQLIEQCKEQRLVFINAHRLSTVVGADQIVVLEEGQVSAMGKHEELYKDHPYYRKLVNHQIIKKEEHS